jgi:5-methylcytosine-specific restriction endonuclease McrA
MNQRRFENCEKHGPVVHVLESATGYWRCQRCRNDHVIKYRRDKKKTLVANAGGKCVICGYDKHFGSLQFHHLNPQEKSFQLSARGRTKSLIKLQEEADKCMLLCANCHQEVEDGVTNIPSYANSKRPRC